MAAELLFSGLKQGFGRAQEMGSTRPSVYRFRLIKAEWKAFGGYRETIRKKVFAEAKKHL
jgi:hypothetical protein